MGLQDNIRAEPVSKLNVREPITVRIKDTVRKAVELMKENQIGCAIVIDKDRHPIGIFSESIATEMLSHGALPLDDPIEKYMSDRCPWVRNTDPIADVIEAMELKNTRLLCVVDEQECVVGITGQRGIMEYVAEHFPGQVMVQRIGQPPFLSDREGA